MVEVCESGPESLHGAEMLGTKKILRGLTVLAGLMALSLSALAIDSDATITIDRVLNSPTLTIRYSGAVASLAELRLNGESFGTRVLNAQTNNGETNFTLTSSVLNDGENAIEIRLFDKDGKLVGTQLTTIFAEKGRSPDVFLSNPKVGQTVQGPVELKVGFGHEMKNLYVSFFVDSQFKLMTNFPPYSYTWDSLRATNGWHEVEAWVVDDSSATFKTKKIRVFVNNPGGNTARIFTKPGPIEAPPTKPLDLQTVLNPTRSQGVDGDAGFRAMEPSAGLAAVITGSASTPLYFGGESLGNPSQSFSLGAASNLKLSPLEALLSTGFRHLTPTGTRMAPVAFAQPVSNPQAELVVSGDQSIRGTVTGGLNPVTSVQSLAPATHAVISIAIAKPTPVRVAGDSGLKPTATVAPVAAHVASTAKLPSVQPLRAVIAVVTPKVTPVISKPVAPVVVAKPTTAPMVAAPVAKPILKVSKMVTTFIRVEPGVKIPHEGNYAVVMDGKLVEFDVQPRVDAGVPMTPFRHLIEKKGGKVDWENQTKSITAHSAGQVITLQIGTKIAQINNASVEMELAPYLERGRTIVPLSFMRDSLHVNIEYDKATNHVLITSIKN